MTIHSFGTQQNRPATRLRQRLRSAYHAMTAESVDFEAMYMTGFDTAAQRSAATRMWDYPYPFR